MAKSATESVEKKLTRRSPIIYTDEQIKWVECHINDYPDAPSLARAFNITFGTKREPRSVYLLCRRHSIMRDNPHIGESKLMKCGLYATIVRWHNKNDIDVEFDGGLMMKSIQYRRFARGSLSPTLYYSDEQKQWLADNRPKHGSLQSLTEDFNERFHTQRSTRSIARFCSKNNISSYPRVVSKYSSYPRVVSKHVGETLKMKCGFNATIIEWRSTYDIDVRFENGVVRNSMSYLNFKRRSITCFDRVGDFIKEHLHEKRAMAGGFVGEIVAIRNRKDIDVKWGDGTVTEHLSYRNFESGHVRIPLNVKYLHQKAKMHCGLMAEIVDINSFKDIVVRFEDGYECRSTIYSWIQRSVDNPNCSKNLIRTYHVGERYITKSGIWCTITAYRGHTDIDIVFDDGSEVFGAIYSSLRKGEIHHPLFLKDKRSRSLDFHGYVLEGRITLDSDDALYKVITPDGDREIMYMSKIIQDIKKREAA